MPVAVIGKLYEADPALAADLDQPRPMGARQIARNVGTASKSCCGENLL